MNADLTERTEPGKPAEYAGSADCAKSATPAERTEAADNRFDDAAEMLSAILDMGEAMLIAGADVSLVEECIYNMGCAYGVESTNAFVITSDIIVTMILPDKTTITESRRVDSAGDTDFAKYEELFHLYAKFHKQPMPLKQFRKELDAICAKPFPRYALYLGGFLSTACFAVFFGGSIPDGIAAGAFSLIICLMIEFVKPKMPNNNVFNFVSSFIVGIGVGLLCKAVPGLDMSMIVVGIIMILIPGAAFTNSARDMIAGNTITGTMRFIESLLWATSLALGFMIAIWLTAHDLDSHAAPLQCPLELQLVMAFLATLGFALFFHVKANELMILAIGGLCTWSIYLLVGTVVENSFVVTFCAAVFGAIFAEILGFHYRAPASIFFIVTVITLIPGRMLYFTMYNAVIGMWAQVAQYGGAATGAALGIAVGLSAVWAANDIWRRFAKPHLSRLSSITVNRKK